MVDPPWRIHFFRRHAGDDPDRTTPGRDFLDSCPTKVRAKFLAVLDAVASAPPPAFSGGGYWEAMHGDMSGFYEVRVDGKDRNHYRLFCVLERRGNEVGLGGPSIVIVTGISKPFKTKVRPADYRVIRGLGDEYRKREPRSVA